MKKGVIIITFFILFAGLNIALYYFWGSNKIISNSYVIVLKILNIVNFFVAFLITISILLKNEHPSSKLLWLMIMLYLPIVGIIFYFMFARDFKNKFIHSLRPIIKERKYLDFEPSMDNIDLTNDIFSYAFYSSRKSIFKNNTKTTILTNGDQLFPRFIQELKAAKDYIFMGFYIIRNDKISLEVMDILEQKVREGLEVKIIYDQLGSRKFSRKIMKKLRHAGVKITPFERFAPSHFVNTINFRYHRKITIIDGRCGFIGGMNLGDEYNHLSKRFGFWRDTHLLLEGKAIISLTNVFLKDWYYATGEWLYPKYQYDEFSEQGRVMVLESGPDNSDPIIKNVYFKAITTATKSIMITTPYLMLEPEMVTALATASRSGVEVSILLPGKPDKFWVNQATKSYYELLMRAGINIYEYNNYFIHSKVLIIDNKYASIGSVNFDPRSFNINFEATVLIENESVKSLINDFENDLKNANKISLLNWRKRSIIKKLLQGFANLFSPLL